MNFQALEELTPNWDGYGAFTPLPETIVRAKKICRSLCTNPELYPLPNGTVELLWELDGVTVSIEVGRTKEAICVFIANDELK